MFARTLVQDRYLFQIAWAEVADQSANFSTPVSMCNTNNPEHNLCSDLALLVENTHVGVFWIPFNQRALRAHVRQANSEDRHLAFVYESVLRYKYMFLTSAREIDTIVQEVNEEFISVHMATTIILSKRNFEWLMLRTSKHVFHIKYENAFIDTFSDRDSESHLFSVI